MPTPRYSEGHSYDWTPERPGEWRDRAACAGMGELFTVRDQEKQSDSLGKWVGYNRAAIKAARVTCFSCPVFFECEADATTEDFTWTVRAGRLPLVFNTKKDAPGRPRKETEFPGEECNKGHVGEMTIRGDGRYRCRACDREYQQKKAAGEGVKPRELKNECANGHVGMYFRESNGKRSCRGCKRVYVKAYDERKRAGGTMPS